MDKLAWIALRCTGAPDFVGPGVSRGALDDREIARTLGASCPVAMSVADALTTVREDDARLLMTAPVDGWLFLVGAWAYGRSGIIEHVTSLSLTFAEAQAFATDPSSDRHHWLRAAAGVLQRAIIWDGTDFLSINGTPTAGEPLFPQLLATPSSEDVFRVAALWSADPREVLAGVESVSVYVAPSAATAIVPALYEADPVIRAAALAEMRELYVADGLGEEGDAACVRAVLEGLKDPAREVRVAALGAMYSVPVPDAGPLLVAWLGAGESDDDVRETLIWRVRDCAPAHAGPVVLRHLTDASPYVRVAAAHVLGDLCVRNAADGLAARISDPKEAPEVRARAVVSLAKLGDPRALDLTMSARRADGIDTSTMIAVCRVIGDARSVDMLANTVNAASLDGLHIIECAEALVALGARRAAPQVAEGLAHPRPHEEQVREKLLESLGALGGPDAFSIIERTMHESQAMTAAGLRALQLLGDPASIPLLERLMGAVVKTLDDNPDNHHLELERMLATLVSLGDTHAEKLVRVFLTHAVERARFIAIAILCEARIANTASLLIKALERDPKWRAGIAQALGRQRDPIAIPTLERLARDPDPTVRLQAAQALTPFHPLTDAILLELSHDPYRRVRAAARRNP